MVLGVGEGLRRQISSASENLKNLRFIWLIDLREDVRGVGFLGRFYETRRRGRYIGRCLATLIYQFKTSFGYFFFAPVVFANPNN